MHRIINTVLFCLFVSVAFSAHAQNEGVVPSSGETPAVESVTTAGADEAAGNVADTNGEDVSGTVEGSENAAASVEGTVAEPDAAVSAGQTAGQEGAGTVSAGAAEKPTPVASSGEAGEQDAKRELPPPPSYKIKMDSEIPEVHRNRRKRNHRGSVIAGNTLFGIGVAMEYTGLGLQIAGLVSGDDDPYLAGIAVGFVGSIPKLAGLITSGVAASRQTKRRFSWGFFGGAMGVGAIRVIVNLVLGMSGASMGAIIGSVTALSLLQNGLFTAHCVRAMKAMPRSRRYSLRPIVQPQTNSYGMALSRAF